MQATTSEALSYGLSAALRASGSRVRSHRPTLCRRIGTISREGGGGLGGRTAHPTMWGFALRRTTRSSVWGGRLVDFFVTFD